MVNQRRVNSTVPIKNQMRVALAQLDLLGFSPEPNAHINNIINPTKGITEIKIVITQSLVDITGAC